ncbi:MAG: DUF4493 domain-containing protein [Muribaculaceae bacterium]|nr:DUF4493 domain-containing protein [Muribaculaceae bacterium]
MMKKIYNILAAGAIALMTLNSCDDPYAAYEETKGEGQLSTKDFVLSVVKEEGTRAVTDVNDFTVKVVNVVNGSEKSWKYSEMPGVITLTIGNYRVEAFNETPQDAAWDAPYYYKDTTITIQKDKMESLGALMCGLCNMKVSVRYDQKLRALLGNDAVVKAFLENNPSKSLDYTLERVDAETAGYFKYVEGSKTMVLEFSGSVKGSKVNTYRVNTEVNPGEHHIVTFGLKDTPGIPGENGYIEGSGMSINTTVTVVKVNNNINPGNDNVDPFESLELSNDKVSIKADGGEAQITVSAKGSNGWFITGVPEWLKVTPTTGIAGTESAEITKVVITAEENVEKESREATINVRMARMTKTVTITQAGVGGSEPDPGLGGDDLPTITSTTVLLNTPIDITNVAQGTQFTVDMTAPKGFKNIFVVIDSETMSESDLEVMGLAQSFDLAHPGDLGEGLESLGFPYGDAVLGQTETGFNISDFVPLIPALGNGRSTFKITVVDNEEQQVSADLIMVVNKNK